MPSVWLFNTGLSRIVELVTPLTSMPWPWLG